MCKNFKTRKKTECVQRSVGEQDNIRNQSENIAQNLVRTLSLSGYPVEIKRICFQNLGNLLTQTSLEINLHLLRRKKRPHHSLRWTITPSAQQWSEAYTKLGNQTARSLSRVGILKSLIYTRIVSVNVYNVPSANKIILGIKVKI